MSKNNENKQNANENVNTNNDEQVKVKAKMPIWKKILIGVLGVFGAFGAIFLGKKVFEKDKKEVKPEPVYQICNDDGSEAYKLGEIREFDEEEKSEETVQ